MTKAEALIIWIANKKRGTFSELKEVIRKIARSESREEANIWPVINGLENLLYIRRAPAGDGWFAVGQQIVVLPGKDGLAILAGCFNREPTIDIGEEYGFWPTYVPASLDPAIARLLPETMYIEAPDLRSYGEFQRETGCGYLSVENAMGRLVYSDGMELKEEVAPPRYDTGDLERFELSNLSYVASPVASRDGLYKQRVRGRLMYWIRSNDIWYRTDRGHGPWLWRSISGEVHEESGLFRYRKQTESLFFKTRIAIPAELGILLTLCSGLLPVIEDNSRRYDNVSTEISEIIFEYLKLNPIRGI
ncbi:hypothetical protein [Glutamicibacter mysorens]|uniref:hypothetical protein n=1 Tax=Glutamicibacter mysorens TaxID=257984 RepID=UPI0020C658A2|nr:hypothetical protein [Glutamicibacter mysorens]UTM45922.1 hypothetical protein XH9_10085 [Glutamicibacter mysorens]